MQLDPPSGRALPCRSTPAMLVRDSKIAQVDLKKGWKRSVNADAIYICSGMCTRMHGYGFEKLTTNFKFS